MLPHWKIARLCKLRYIPLDITPAQERSRGYELQPSQNFPAAPAREREPQREIERRKKAAARRCAGASRHRRIAAPANRAQSFGSLARTCLSASMASCPATAFYLKAVTNPAATTTATWAAELVDHRGCGFHRQRHAAQSAFAQLSQRAMTVTLRPGVGVIKIPSRTSPQVLSGAWLAEGSAQAGVSRLADFDGP